MSLSITPLVNTVITLFIVIIISVIATKAKLINQTFTKGFSTFIICVCQPFMIMKSLSNHNIPSDMLGTGFAVAGIGCITLGICAAVAFFASKPVKDFNEKKIAEFGLIFANTGFMGIPVLESCFGEKGAFYGAFFVISFQTVVWSYGMFILSKKRPDIKIKPWKLFINYGTIPVMIGIIMYLLPFDMPVPVQKTMDMLNGICAPGSMVIIGSIVASIPVKKLLLDKNIYYLCALRLIILPMVVSSLSVLCGLSEDLVYLFTILTALPSATSCAMYAQKYDIAPDFGAKLSSVSTLFSIGTIPLMIYFAKFLLSFR